MNFAALLLSLSLQASPTSAQADEFFAKAKAEMKAGHVKEACNYFAESYRLEPALGALLNLASCYETQGRLASSFLRFNEAEAWAARTSDRPRQEFAAEHARALKPRVSWLALTTAAPMTGLVAKVGDSAETPLAGTPLVVAVDPGIVHVVVSAPGMKSWSVDVEAAAQGTTRALTAPALESINGDAPEAKQVVVTPAQGTPKDTAMQPANVVTPAGGTKSGVSTSPQPQRSSPGGAIAMVIGGSAVAAAGAVGLGWTFANYIPITNGSSKETDGQIREKLTTMQTVYPASWVAFGVGAATTIVGAIMWSNANTDSNRPTLSVMPTDHGAMVSLSGSF